MSQPYFLLFITCVTFLYISIGAIYRLYLSPVASYPGPRFAALTFWYEFYYDVVCKGRYTWKIKELHKQYGPVIRINPEELHVADSTFYDSVYAGPSRRTEKWGYSARMFGTSLAAVGTTSYEIHRLRRSALNGFFSKRSVLRLEPTIQQVIHRACTALQRGGVKGRVIDLRAFFAAFSADVISEVAFGNSYGLLDSSDFEPKWQHLMMNLSRATHLMKQFPWAYTFLTSIPPSLVTLIHPLTRKLFDIRKDIQLKITHMKEDRIYESEKDYDLGEVNGPTIIHHLLSNSNLPPSELQMKRLEDEAFTLLGAGTITTAHTLTTILYHVLASPFVRCQLESELSDLYFNTSEANPSLILKHLEHAPYLSAIISEGLRLSFGVAHRLPRISPDTPLHYRGNMDGRDFNYTIPPGTPVSMTQMFVHLDPEIFPSPEEFDPRRWLTPQGSDEVETEMLRRRKQYLVPFSRGTRMCAGMHLAYAELYLMLGTLFAPGGVGREMDLFDTSVEDVECVHDFFNPSPRLDSKGVRVTLREKV